MAKRNKHPRMPNGYGTIRFLGSGRRNPYAVNPPVTEFTLDGVPITPKALCYVDDWYKGFAVLTSYKAGTYYNGYELTLDKGIVTDSKLAEKILADYNRTKSADRRKPQGLTFAQVYEDFRKWKFNESSVRNTVMSYESYMKAIVNTRYSRFFVTSLLLTVLLFSDQKEKVGINLPSQPAMP